MVAARGAAADSRGVTLPPRHEAGRAFVFRHPLVRRAVYDGVAPAWRLGAHERVAAALEQRGAGPAARAFHVVRSAHVGDPEAIAVALRRRGDRRASSPAAAAHWFAAALRLVPHGDATLAPTCSPVRRRRSSAPGGSATRAPRCWKPSRCARASSS